MRTQFGFNCFVSVVMPKISILIIAGIFLLSTSVRLYACSAPGNPADKKYGDHILERQSYIFLGTVIQIGTNHDASDNSTCLSVQYKVQEIYHGSPPNKIGFSSCGPKEDSDASPEFYEHFGLFVGAKSIVGLTKTSPDEKTLGMTSEYRPLLLFCHPFIVRVDNQSPDEVSDFIENAIVPLINHNQSK